LHNVVKVLTKIADRYAPSRVLSFDLAHVFKALQLMHQNGRISRSLLIDELDLGEGSIKTLVKHLKMHDIVETSKAGMKLTNKGNTLFSKLQSAIPSEMEIKKCSIGIGKYNHAVLVKNLGDNIGTGIEQRDAAIKIGALGATTLIFKDGKFLMPDRNQYFLRNEPKLRTEMLEKLKPEDNDIIIIGSSENRKNAELAAKSAALQTIADHDKHY
jgi:hypothetical protein